MGLVLVTPPDGEPLVPQEAIDHLRLEASTSEDALLAAWVTAAREVVEHRTQRSLLTQTWELTLEGFPCGRVIHLPRPPLKSVTSITYVDTAGASQTLATSAYQVDTTGIVGRIRPAYATPWPPTRCQFNAVTIRFVAGYGDPAAVPAALKAAMQLLLANWYENREAVITGTIATQLPLGVEALLDPYQVLEPA